MTRGGGFPGPEHPCETDEITAAKQPGQALGKASRGVEVGQLDAGGCRRLFGGAQVSFSMAAYT